MNKSIPFCLAVLLAPSVIRAQVVVDDNWADGDRAKTGELDADWWSSNHAGGNSVEADVNELGLISGTAGRGIHATFTPIVLAVGDTLTVTFTFTTPATVGTNRGTALKAALMDFNDPGLAADLNSSSSDVNPLYTNLPGYMVDFDVNKTDTETDADNTSIRKHDTPNTSGRFLGTTGEWSLIGGSENPGYAILPNTEYVGVMSLSKTGADTLDIFASLSQGGTLLDSHTVTDESGTANNIGMLGFWVNSNTFGSTNSSGDPDNGITFSHVTVERTPHPPVVVETIATSIDYMIVEGTESVTIQWNAEIGATYLVFGSDDLSTWEELTDLTADAETESFTEEVIDGGHRFYRIEKE
ncbi:MAG: hypothetical protein ACSHYF_08630 [Verrucomicrobiaceae bacterium]